MLLYTDGQLTVLSGLILAVPAIAVALWIWRRRSRSGEAWTLMALVALAHITLLIGLTIFPIPLSGQDYYRHTRGLSEDNLIPFRTIHFQLFHLSLNTIRQLVGNMLALAPLGVYAPFLWPPLRRWWRFVLVAAAIAVGIEVTQFAGSVAEGFTYRVTDVDDAIMNTTGAVLGFLLWPVVARKMGWRQFLAEREAAP